MASSHLAGIDSALKLKIDMHYEGVCNTPLLTLSDPHQAKQTGAEQPGGGRDRSGNGILRIANQEASHILACFSTKRLSPCKMSFPQFISSNRA
jgi:hypothetical protein